MRVEVSGTAHKRRIASAIKLAGLALLSLVAAGRANATYIETNHQFITNGGFETLTNGVGKLTTDTVATGWVSGRTSNNAYPGYNFVFSSATASTTGAGGLSLWGPGNGSANGLGASPSGGNFLAADGAYQQGPIAQFVTDLIVGQTYTLSFDFAGAQQNGFTGPTTEMWNYGLSGEAINLTTATLSNASHGFTGWQHVSTSFVATQTSDYLYFLAKGTPDGQPPFSLLDSVSLTGSIVSAAPEAATWQMLILGFGSIGFAIRRRRRATTRAVLMAVA